MKTILSLLLAGGLLVPLFSTDALATKSSATAPHKKASHHKRHARHAKASTASPASAEKPAQRPTTAPTTAE